MNTGSPKDACSGLEVGVGIRFTRIPSECHSRKAKSGGSDVGCEGKPQVSDCDSRKIREALGLQPGDRLLLRLENDRVVMRLRPRSLARHLRGLHKEVWQDVDALSYVEQERASWESEA